MSDGGLRERVIGIEDDVRDHDRRLAATDTRVELIERQLDQHRRILTGDPALAIVSLPGQIARLRDEVAIMGSATRAQITTLQNRIEEPRPVNWMTKAMFVAVMLIALGIVVVILFLIQFSARLFGVSG